MNSKPRVLVTDGCAKSTLAIVRSLTKRGIHVHVASDKRLAIAGWSRFASKKHLTPASKTNPDAFIEAVLALQKRWQYDVVMPVSDYDIAALLDADPSRIADLTMALPTRASFHRAWDKSQMMQVAIEAGVPCPETYFPEDESMATIARRARFPLLIKPNISAGARGITMVTDQAELEPKYRDVVERWGPSHLQEFIPPGGGQFKSEIIVGETGETLALFVCEKLRFFPVEGGSSTLITSRKHAQIERDVKKLAVALNWRGFADFDFIVDPRDGIAKLMECNPRFPESIVINVFAGADFPWCLYQLARNKTADPILDYSEGRFARFLVGDIMWFLNSTDRWKAKPAFFNFFNRNVKYYIEQLNDPGPTACYLLESLLTLFSPDQMAYRFGRGFRGTRKEETKNP